MLTSSPYQFGYSWFVTHGHLVPLLIAALVGGVALWRGWPRWVTGLSGLVALWAIAGLIITHAVIGINAPVELPTSRFLASGSGRVLDAGAGSGRASVGILLARPQARVTGLDLYQGYWGIDGNTPARFMANARIAGAADRAEARTGDMRDMPFSDAEFDAVVSVAAIDHLRRSDIVKTLEEMARVLRPRGEVLLMIVDPDWVTKVASPHAIAHHRRQDPVWWRTTLEQCGFGVEEEGRQPGGLYVYARKRW
jgi:SAM-dependent methyltransferase